MRISVATLQLLLLLLARVTSSVDGTTKRRSLQENHVCKTRANSKTSNRKRARTCGGPEVLARSYPIMRRWPFDAFQLVMEMKSGTCDLYRQPKSKMPSICCRITDSYHQPEQAVREAIGSFLIGCSRRPAEKPCRAIDLGANNGWFSAYMLQLGAHVTAIEPQPDLAHAAMATAKLNCWSERFTIVNARACIENEHACFRPVSASDCHVGGWREGGGRSQISEESGSNCANLHGLPSTVGGVSLRKILLQSPNGGSETNELDFVKIDVDGPEGRWFTEMDRLISMRLLVIRTILVEASFIKPSQMRRFQRKHGYTAYRLDAHDSRRFMTRTGWDAYSANGTISRLDRFSRDHMDADRAMTRYSPHNPRYGAKDQQGPSPAADGRSRFDLEEELFSVRAMRHVYRAKANLTLQAWTTLMQPIQHDGYESAPHQWLLTLEGDLTEPTVPGSDWRHRSPEYAHAKAAGYSLAHVDVQIESLKD